MSLPERLLGDRGFAVLDGGLATELERRGADLNHPLWSARLVAEAPDRITAVHEAYFAAGADVAIGASYQATVTGFMGLGATRSEAEDLLQLTVELPRRARASYLASDALEPRGALLVAASVGPFGAAQHDGSEYRGAYGLTQDALRNFHGPRLACLTRAQPDLFAVETIPSVPEASVVLDLLDDHPDIPAWVCYTCRNGQETGEGQGIEAAVEAVAGHPSVFAVGVNCTAPDFVEEILRRMANVTDKPLVAYPNSGERWNAARHAWEPPVSGETPDQSDARWAEWACRWYDAGARLIGGCCRTGPATIAAIRSGLLAHVHPPSRPHAL